MIKRPLKAPTESITNEQLTQLRYPFLGSPKIDGIRCLIIDGEPKTSSLKPQPNDYVRNYLADFKFNYLDGELVVGNPSDPNSFNNSTGPLRRKDGTPDFTFLIFDYFAEPSKPYTERWIDHTIVFNDIRVKILPQTLLHCPNDVIAFESKCVDMGFEGAMIRSLDGVYKQGRATFREANIFKRKPLEDSEAVIIGFTELQINLNEQTTNELGLSKRSSHQENKFGADTLGSFILLDLKWKQPFNCRGKISASLAKEIWDNKEKYLGKKVTYKYQKHGSIDAPRQPIFKAFYEED